MSTTNLRVSELDFDTIKENLTDFLRNKPEFKDYDFTGSALSTLLGVLAYNTHYNAVLDNQAAQELTLDTSRNKTVTALHAKRLGYTPVSALCARAFVDLEVFPSGSPSTLTIGSNAVFNSVGISNATYVFNTLYPSTISISNGRWIFKNLEIIEGQHNTFRYLYGTRTKFEIPEEMVDISTLRVFVQTSATNTRKIEYIKTDKITNLDGESTVFFVQVNRFGRYEVYFGDNIIGKQPIDGNVVEMRYYTSSGEDANGVQAFEFIDYVEGNGNTTTKTIEKSFGAAVPESNESIKYNAYKNTIVQDRTVTANDYEAILPTIYPIDSISVWGGENNDPPTYGKVFMAIKPKGSELNLTQSGKDFITKYLSDNKSIVTVSPAFVDVDYLYLDINSVVYIDDTVGSHSPSYIKTKVISSINKFSDMNLGKFQKIFRFSRLGYEIDATDTSILSNITSVSMFKKFVPDVTTKSTYKLSFSNPIVNGSLTSSTFSVGTSGLTLSMKDTDGVLSLIYNDGGSTKTYMQNAGNIDYSKGVISIDPVLISSFQGEHIKVSVVPVSNDIVSMRQLILKINPEDVDVTVVQDSKDGVKHIFPGV